VTSNRSIFMVNVIGCRDLSGAEGAEGIVEATEPSAERRRLSVVPDTFHTIPPQIERTLLTCWPPGGGDKHHSSLVLLGPLGANLGGHFVPAHQWMTTKSIYT